MANIFASGFSLGGYTVLCLAGALTSLSKFQEWLETRSDGSRGPREFPDLEDHIPGLLENSAPFRTSQERHSNSFRDPRVKSVMALAPAPTVRGFLPKSVATIDIPVSLMVGQSDTEAPHDACAAWLVHQNPAFELTLLGSDVGHYVFLCEPTEIGKSTEPEICLDASGVERGAVHDQAAEIADGLFRSAMTSAERNSPKGTKR